MERRSDTGGRDYQEDFYGACYENKFQLLKETRTWNLTLPDGDYMFVMTDGMGGMGHGDEAASKVLQAFVKHLVNNYPDSNRVGPEELKAALAYANKELGRYVDENPTKRGMGCTIIAAYVSMARREISWLSVGDSPLWRLHGSKLVRVNQIHNWGNQAYRVHEQQKKTDPSVTLEYIMNLNNPDHLVSAVTGGDINLVDTKTEALHERDVYIIASDGLETLSDREIIDSLAFNEFSPSEAPQKMAQATQALMQRVTSYLPQKPSQDNTTAVAFAVYDDSSGPIKFIWDALSSTMMPAADGGGGMSGLVRKGVAGLLLLAAIWLMAQEEVHGPIARMFGIGGGPQESVSGPAGPTPEESEPGKRQSEVRGAEVLGQSASRNDPRPAVTPAPSSSGTVNINDENIGVYESTDTPSAASTASANVTTGSAATAEDAWQALSNRTEGGYGALSVSVINDFLSQYPDFSPALSLRTEIFTAVNDFFDEPGVQYESDEPDTETGALGASSQRSWNMALELSGLSGSALLSRDGVERVRDTWYDRKILEEQKYETAERALNSGEVLPWAFVRDTATFYVSNFPAGEHILHAQGQIKRKNAFQQFQGRLDDIVGLPLLARSTQLEVLEDDVSRAEIEPFDKDLLRDITAQKGLIDAAKKAEDDAKKAGEKLAREEAEFGIAEAELKKNGDASAMRSFLDSVDDPSRYSDRADRLIGEYETRQTIRVSFKVKGSLPSKVDQIPFIVRVVEDDETQRVIVEEEFPGGFTTTESFDLKASLDGVDKLVVQLRVLEPGSDTLKDDYDGFKRAFDNKTDSIKEVSKSVSDDILDAVVWGSL